MNSALLDNIYSYMEYVLDFIDYMQDMYLRIASVLVRAETQPLSLCLSCCIIDLVDGYSDFANQICNRFINSLSG